MPLELSINNEQAIDILWAPTTPGGQPATLDGPMRISIIGGDATFVEQPDRIWLLSADTPGDTTYLFEGDADLGQGVVLIQDTVLLHTTGAMAGNLGLSAGGTIVSKSEVPTG